MLDVDRGWPRQHQRFGGLSSARMSLRVVVISFSVAGSAACQANAVAFVAGSIVFGVMAAASPTGQAATKTNRPGLDTFSLASSYGSDNRVIVGPTETI